MHPTLHSLRLNSDSEATHIPDDSPITFVGLGRASLLSMRILDRLMACPGKAVAQAESCSGHGCDGVASLQTVNSSIASDHDGARLVPSSPSFLNTTCGCGHLRRIVGPPLDHFDSGRSAANWGTERFSETFIAAQYTTNQAASIDFVLYFMSAQQVRADAQLQRELKAIDTVFSTNIWDRVIIVAVHSQKQLSEEDAEYCKLMTQAAFVTALRNQHITTPWTGHPEHPHAGRDPNNGPPLCLISTLKPAEEVQAIVAKTIWDHSVLRIARPWMATETPWRMLARLRRTLYKDPDNVSDAAVSGALDLESPTVGSGYPSLQLVVAGGSSATREAVANALGPGEADSAAHRPVTAATHTKGGDKVRRRPAAVAAVHTVDEDYDQRDEALGGDGARDEVAQSAGGSGSTGGERTSSASDYGTHVSLCIDLASGSGPINCDAPIDLVVYLVESDELVEVDRREWRLGAADEAAVQTLERHLGEHVLDRMVVVRWTGGDEAAAATSRRTPALSVKVSASQGHSRLIPYCEVSPGDIQDAVARKVLSDIRLTTAPPMLAPLRTPVLSLGTFGSWLWPLGLVFSAGWKRVAQMCGLGLLAVLMYTANRGATAASRP